MAFNITQQITSKTGGLKQLFLVSFPLVLSLLSGSLMFFFGRLLLANYSIDAHNASVSAGMIVACLEYPFLCVVSIAEVFVGQANGSGEKEKIGVPVWQMIWLSLFSLVLFLPIAFFFPDALFPESPLQEMEISYFTYLSYFSPAFCAAVALSAFYIGRGAFTFVTIMVILSNVLNVALSYLLIFGFEPFVPALGITGAAIATGVSQLFQALVLLIDFLRLKNRQQFGTGKFQFVWPEFLKCIKVGLPSSLAHTIEIIAWAIFFRMLINLGPDHATVVSVAQSIFFLFTFMTEGISKGATALAANFIGANRFELLNKLLKSGIKLYLILFAALGVLLVMFPSTLVGFFMTEPDEKIHEMIVASCFWVWLFFLFDGVHWLVVGLLTASNDTKFVFKVGSSVVWLCALLPTYVLVVLMGYLPNVAWEITAFYGLVISLIYLHRFFSGRWKENLLAPI